MLYLKLVVMFLVSFNCLAKEDEKNIINGKPLICNREAYNCPTSDSPLKNKRLKNCEEVKIVWTKCKEDIHGLDADNDNKPCEDDCGF